MDNENVRVAGVLAGVEETRAGLWFHSPAKEPNQLSPVVLAYIGDAVFELLIRQYLISQPNHKLHHLHKEAISRVSAKAQCALLQRLMPALTEEEADIVRRGRNAKSGNPPKNADPHDYRQATALECLFGYLYYQQRSERIHELLDIAIQRTSTAAHEEEENT
ncbi:Mini-ribonuclease 3 [Paenibacillus sp. GCM10012307]|uniref:Mini-ribonuclease 3 n=1 Tax=Paenibacillus roseus TaxID=2798579 RepID=A0A934J570_9BACL|nr:ribonuclease III domain-containing protein [Paenibacillus roseus]MBJ6361011.1 ribonuclease III [Paenibacillus roseus]